MKPKAPRARRRYGRPPAVTRHSTVREKPPLREDLPKRPAVRAHTPKPTQRRTQWAYTSSPRRQAARLIDSEDASVLDLIDNLLNKGVVLNADLILALANVDLVYVRLSALLCAADRLARGRRR